MAYQPRPGTLAEKAISFLRHTKGRISTADLAAHLGCHPASMTASLITAVKHGVVRRGCEGHRTYWWIDRPDEFNLSEFVAFLDGAMHGKRLHSVDIDAVHFKRSSAGGV